MKLSYAALKCLKMLRFKLECFVLQIHILSKFTRAIDCNSYYYCYISYFYYHYYIIIIINIIIIWWRSNVEKGSKHCIVLCAIHSNWLAKEVLASA